MKRNLFVLLSLALVSFAAHAQQRVALREGLIVHPTDDVAYVMTPQGGIAAIDLLTGTRRWTSDAAAKPLALSGALLVGQVEPRTAAQMRRLELVALDTRERGAASRRNATELPAGVRATIGETILGRMVSTGRADAGGVLVTWQYLPREIKGQDEGDEVRPAIAGAVAAQRTGAVRMSLSTGAMTRADAPAGMIPPASSTWLVASNRRTAAAPSAPTVTQYESADGKHLLQSERIADDRTWEKYRWTIVERADGNKIGEMRSHLSFAPFVVRESTVVFETTPYILGRDVQPAKLRGVNLQTGREAWSVEVREIVYRGEMPP